MNGIIWALGGSSKVKKKKLAAIDLAAIDGY